ncbi:MAG: hypothetical protein ACRDPF_21180 [Streptosporangiaceae bacterium]
MTRPGSDLLTNSRPVAGPPPGAQLNDLSWRGAIIATGSVLVASGVRKGKTAGILRGHRYTPIPWDRHIATAIW